MKHNYAYQWLEQLITTDLHSEMYEGEPISEEKYTQTMRKLSEDKIRICNELKEEVFAMNDEDQIGLFVRKHHKAIIHLIDKTFQLKVRQEIQGKEVQEVLSYTFIVLETMQQFVEVNYPLYLSPEDRVPLPELLELRDAILQKMEVLPDILREGRNSEKNIEIVLEAYHEFVQRIDKREMITAREANYHRELLRDLMLANIESNVLPDCPTLHEMLFNWNFNSKSMMSYFTGGLQQLLAAKESTEEKLEFLRIHFKQLLHLPVKPQVIYDKEYPSIKSHFSNWIENEILYLEQRASSFSPITQLGKSGARKVDSKVELTLSSDQAGLILRSAYELQVLKSRSMSAVFKNIVPALQTKGAEEPDWDNMRSSTYRVERSDKAVAVAVLNKIIAHIQTY